MLRNILLNFKLFQWYVLFMPTLKEKIEKLVSEWETDLYDPKEELIRLLDEPETFEHFFPCPKPPREKQIRLLIEALLL